LPKELGQVAGLGTGQRMCGSWGRLSNTGGAALRCHITHDSSSTGKSRQGSTFHECKYLIITTISNKHSYFVLLPKLLFDIKPLHWLMVSIKQRTKGARPASLGFWLSSWNFYTLCSPAE